MLKYVTCDHYIEFPSQVMVFHVAIYHPFIACYYIFVGVEYTFCCFTRIQQIDSGK